MNHVLITGGSGLIGRYLTSLLLGEGYRVSHLSRKQDQFGKVRVHRWDPENEILDPASIDGIDFIVHLAGANLASRRWTRQRKEKIIRSRVNGAKLLYKVISENKIPLKAFITASGINYYGTITSDRILSEEDGPGKDFPSEVCKLWEEAADNFTSSGIRTVKLRSAVVLEREEGALPRLLLTSKLGVFAIPGNGDQYLPWIHIRDLCGIYLKAITDSGMEGAFNTAAPQDTTVGEFLRSVADIMHRRFIHVNIPGIALKTIYGNMSSIVLEGSRVSSRKIKDAGYRFEFDNLHNALSDIIYPRSASRQP